MSTALQVEEAAEVRRHAITLEEYERMCVAGVFDEDARVELIRGEIVDMPPPGPEHEGSVTFLNLFLVEQLQRRALVWPQGNAVRLPESNSRPQPDLTILKWRDDMYRGKRPMPEDVIVLIEVSHSTLNYDRGSKLALYAEAGIPEYWIVNLVDKVVEVYTDPREGKYQSVRQVKSGETMQLPGGIEGNIAVDDIVG